MSSSRVLPIGDPAVLGFVPARFQPLHRRLQQFVADGQHAGVNLLLARNGEIADTFAVGFRNRELGLPMTRDTIVRVYSLTKMVVSAAALTLLEEGELGLLDLVADYLPEFRDLRVLVGGTFQDPQLVPADKPLTIQHLFSHTSGLIYEAPDEPIGEFYRPLWGGGESKSLEQFVSTLAKLPLKWHPGTRFEFDAHAESDRRANAGACPFCAGCGGFGDRRPSRTYPSCQRTGEPERYLYGTGGVPSRCEN
jgi:CubicO group peptidase (beta-lactamase class C family)